MHKQNEMEAARAKEVNRIGNILKVKPIVPLLALKNGLKDMKEKLKRQVKRIKQKTDYGV